MHLASIAQVVEATGWSDEQLQEKPAPVDVTEQAVAQGTGRTEIGPSAVGGMDKLTTLFK